MSTHHMVKEHTAHEEAFFRELKNLVPILQELSKKCFIVWLHQYPTQDFFGATGANNVDVHASKIWHYNRETNRILRCDQSNFHSWISNNKSISRRNGGIPVWDSGSPLVEEYIRSCLIQKRQDAFYKSYFDCTDYIHPGLSAMTDITQILYNYLLPRD